MNERVKKKAKQTVRRIVVVARGHTAHHGHDATFDPNILACFSSHAIDRPESFV